MAVWIQIIGLRELESIEKERKKISNILSTTHFDFDFMGCNSEDDPVQFPWNLTQSNGLEFFEVNEQSLKIYFENPNFISFSGCFDYFSAWYRFTDPEQSELTNAIRRIFQQIAFSYGISELIYFSEWFFPLEIIPDKTATFEDLLNLIKDNPSLSRNELFGLESNQH
jgi:hypothetical protein